MPEMKYANVNIQFCQLISKDVISIGVLARCNISVEMIRRYLEEPRLAF
jgi:hypothetical protein